MADNNYLAYASDEDEAGYNDRYEALPEEVQSSEDGLPEIEEDDEDEETEEEEDEDPPGIDPKNGKFRDPKHDPYTNWHKICVFEPILMDFTPFLLDDPDLQNMWEKQDEDQKDTETEIYSDEDDDEDEDDDIFAQRQNSSGDEEGFSDIGSTGEETEEEAIEEDSAPPTPINFDPENGRMIAESDDDEQKEEGEKSDFSLGDINTEGEDEDEKESEMGNKENVDKETDEEEDDDKDEGGGTEIEEDEGRKRKLRKIPKDSDDSGPTEWETVTEEESEPEGPEISEPEQEVVEVVLEKPKTPDPYGYTELHTHIEHIEEFDDDFMTKFLKKYKSSANSTSDESDYQHGSYDVEKYKLQRKYSVIQANKTESYCKNNQGRRKISVANSNNKNTKNDRKKTGNHRKRHGSNDITPRSFSGYPRDVFVDLDVYNYHLPNYSSDEGYVREPMLHVEHKRTAKKDRSMKGSKKKMLRKRKILEKLYENCHPWHVQMLKAPDPNTDQPSKQVPSYKVKARHQEIKDSSVRLALDKVLTQTYKAIDEIERIKLHKEATYNCQFLLLKLADDVVGECEEIQQRSAARYAIEVLLDRWEEHVYTKRKNLIEQQLDDISETLVTKVITKIQEQIMHEDRVAAITVRNSLASALESLGKNHVRIHRKLNNMFEEYEFEDYSFNKGDKKEKQRVYKRRKELDVYLKQRAERINDSITPENQKKKKKDYEKNDNTPKTKDKQLNQIEEEDHREKRDAKHEENVKEESEDVFNVRDEPVFLPSHCLSGGEEPEKIYDETAPSLEQMHKVNYRQVRRASALKAWFEKDKSILEGLREENEKWNALFDKKTNNNNDWVEMMSKRKDQIENDKDLNELYALSEEEKGEEEEEEVKENEESEDEPLLNDDKMMPVLNEIVKQAIKNPESKIVVVPTKKRVKYVLRGPIRPQDEDSNQSEDSAVDSGAEEMQVTQRQRKKSVVKPPVVRRDTGISSIGTKEEKEEEVLTGKELEREKSMTEFINLIPTLDRDQFLNQWLISGAPKQPVPPPERPPSRVRRLRLRRPSTAESVASIRDVVPLETKTYTQLFMGRLNSAKSSRSSGRPGSAHSIYTDRSSLHSRLEDREESTEIESDEEDNKVASYRKKEKSKTTKIKYKQELGMTRPYKDEKVEKEIETVAWNFYLRQNREMQRLQETVESNGRPQLFEDYKFPDRDFKREDFYSVLHKYGEIKINGIYEHEVDEIELLNIAQKSGSSSDDSKEEREKGNCPSVSPPPTPWHRQKNRPLTPDSVDSDEELQKIKKKHYELYAKKQRGPKNEQRLYKEYLRRKDTTLPPPPKLGWVPTQGLIRWKNASDDVKKVKDKRNVDISLNRTLFNQLQISVKRNEKNRRQDRLLQRRATLHTEQLSVSNLEKRKKILPEGVDPSVSPRSTKSTKSTKSMKSVPSYARTTQATKQRLLPEKERMEKLPKILCKGSAQYSTASKSKKATTARR